MMSSLLFCSVQGKDVDLNLAVSSPDVNYELATQGRYLRFRALGQEVGFYMKSCHAKVVEALEDEVKKSTIAFARQPKSLKRNPAAVPDYAGIKFSGAHYKVNIDSFKSSPFAHLQTKIFRLMNLGKKLCPQ